MTKKSINVGVIACLILLLMNLFLSLQIRRSTKYFKNEINQYKNKIVADSIEINNLKAGILLEYWLNKDETREFLKTILSDLSRKEKFILYLQEGQCLSCDRSIIMDFELLYEETGYNEILIVGNYNSPEDLQTALNRITTDITFKSYQFNIDLPFFCEYPAVFTIDLDFNIRNFYIPQNFPELRNDYFYNKILKQLNIM